MIKEAKVPSKSIWVLPTVFGLIRYITSRAACPVLYIDKKICTDGSLQLKLHTCSPKGKQAAKNLSLSDQTM